MAIRASERVISSLDTRATHSRKRAKARLVLVRYLGNIATRDEALYHPPNFISNSAQHGPKTQTNDPALFFASCFFSLAFLFYFGWCSEEFGIKSFSIDGSAVKVTIWDTAGQDRFKVLTKGYYRGSQGALIGAFGFLLFILF